MPFSVPTTESASSPGPSPTPKPTTYGTTAPEGPTQASAAALARQYNAKGELELMFVREIASAETTFHSLQRAVDKLCAAEAVDDIKIDRLSRAQSRYQRMQTAALKELKDLQQRRNLTERFPEQTHGCPPLADHVSHVGESPRIKPIPPLLRGRLHLPTDHRRLRVSTPSEGNIKHLVPEEAPATVARR